eukprot:gene24423-30767_t
MVFVPSSETILELLRIWKQRNNPENMNKLCTWLLSCITLEFDEMMIVAAHFNHSLFQKCYTQEIIESVQRAAVQIQANMRRFLSNKALRVSMLKAKQIQESRILAAMRVKAVQRAKLPAASNRSDAYDNGYDNNNNTNRGRTHVSDSSGINTTELLVSIKQIISEGNQERRKKKRKGSPKKGRKEAEKTLASSGPVPPIVTAETNSSPVRTSTSAKIAHAPRSPASGSSRKANSRGRKIQFQQQSNQDSSASAGEYSSSNEREVHAQKTDFDGALNNFQGELDNLRFELNSQQGAHRPVSSQQQGQQFQSQGNSRGGSRNGSRPTPNGRVKSAGFESDKLVMHFGEGSSDPDSMRQEISSLLLKIGSLEEHLSAQRIANERAQEIAKLEIMSAKLEAESAVERAAARVRNETIQEIASQMKEIEKERARQEEEKAQRDLIREESMRREIEKKQSHMSEKLKQELFKQQMLQQQEQTALIQRQQEMQEKLHQAQQQMQHTNRAPPTNNDTTTIGPGGNEHVALLSPGQKASSVHVSSPHRSAAGKESSVSTAESASTGAPAKKKNSWNWLMFGGGSSATTPKQSNSSQSAPRQPQAQLHMAPPLKPVDVVPEVTVPEEPVVDLVAIEAERRRNEAIAEREAQRVREAARIAQEQYDQKLMLTSIVRIQRAALRMLNWRRFVKTPSFVVLRGQKLLKIVDSTKDENVINAALSTALELNHEALATKTLNRLNNLVAKYDKSGVLYPADYELLVAFLRHFLVDTALMKKGFDVLNVVLKLNADRFDSTDTSLIELLMAGIEQFINDPLMCFKITRCIYRMSEKSASNRELFGGNVENLVSIRKLFEIYLKNPSIIENIMKCVINLCIDSVANQDTFNSIGLCDCVFFAFMEHLKVERLFYLICRAMVNLCANNHYANQTQFAKGIYPNIFIKAVMLYKANPRAIEQVITCVLSIVANHKVNKTKFQEAGLCEVLLDLVRISEAYPSILTNCFWALSNLTSMTNPSRKVLHVKIMEVLKRYEEDESNTELSRHAKIALHRIFRATASRAATPITSMNVVGGFNANTIAAPNTGGLESATGTANSKSGSGGRPRRGDPPAGSVQRMDGFSESVISELST